jgi:acyl-CoA reductase-like NAD-dependent aldehyde dehydrogenase
VHLGDHAVQHPLNMISHKIAPAIATNNRVVAKPTELTPLTALLLADILYEAACRREMLSIVTGNPRSMGDAMITDPRADIVTFTAASRSASTSPRRPATSAWCWSSAATIR